MSTINVIYKNNLEENQYSWDHFSLSIFMEINLKKEGKMFCMELEFKQGYPS